MTTFEIVSIVLLSLILILNVYLIFRKKESKTEVGYKAELLNIRKDFKSSFDNFYELFDRVNLGLQNSMKIYNENVVNFLSTSSKEQREQLKDILTGNKENLEKAIDTLDRGLTKLQQDNEKKLEQMRQTVDEKLNVSLERRLTNSFNIINERLEDVYKGLGEMKSLAVGVGDLKKVLTNVKTRGVWGEISLGNLLEQMLTSNQFVKNAVIKRNSQERCDYAIYIPGKDDKTILLPVDAKFPIEDYQRLCEASEMGDRKGIDFCLKGIEKRIKEEAKSIKEKYIDIPNTTDFAIMYLPIEGLYAEVLRRPGLVESVQQDYRVIICGPTTLSAILNSFQLGFRSLTIEKRSTEIWQLLGIFKKEFSKFVELLAKTQKKLSEASNTIEVATKKSQTIEKKLKGVAEIEDCNTEIDETMLISEDGEE